MADRDARRIHRVRGLLTTKEKQLDDVYREQRQAWIRAMSHDIPLCYQRKPDGSYAWLYTPAAEQSETYLRDKFQAMKAAA